MKERSGFSGGFKIPQETLKSGKAKKKGPRGSEELEEEPEAGHGTSQITKDEVFQQLALGAADSGAGVGKSGNSKAAIAKDLVDGIEKDLEKLRRQQENIQLRKHLALTG